MRKLLLFSIVALSLLCSCKAEKEIPFTVCNGYFIRNDAKKLPSNKILSRQDLEASFGYAAVMGPNGKPTVINFQKQFLIAVAFPVTDFATTLTPQKLILRNNTLHFYYHTVIGNKQTYSIRPFLLIAVDKTHETNQVLCTKK